MFPDVSSIECCAFDILKKLFSAASKDIRWTLKDYEREEKKIKLDVKKILLLIEIKIQYDVSKKRN